MARPKKADEKPKDAAALQISVEDFIRTRDSVVTGLSTLQSAVSDLSRAYIAHTNTVLGKGAGSSLDQLSFANPLGGENGLFSARGPTPAPTTEVAPEGKKRKRAPHDKNAPKRALTPFFLYLQTARPQIAKEMGDKHTAKEVQDEGGKRWREMPQEEKEHWNEQYGINFARYKEHMKAYKAGQTIPEISDALAKQLYDQNKKAGKIPRPSGHEVEHVSEADESEDSDTTSATEESPEPEPAREPTPPPAKKQKTAKEAGKKRTTSGKQTAAVETEREAVPTFESAKKEKKASKKKDSKAADDTSEAKHDPAIEPASSPVKATKDQKKKGKKRKSGEIDF